MQNNQSEHNAQIGTLLPPPPPPIASLMLTPPTITQHSYTLYHQRKHLRMLNGQAEYSTQQDEVNQKLKKQFNNAQSNSHETESSIFKGNSAGDKISRNLDICTICPKCQHWIQKDEMKLHLSFHVAPIFDNLLLGDKHSSSSHKQLFIRNKVTHILNAAYQLKNYFQSEGIKYRHLDLADQIGQSVIDEAKKGAQFIDQSMKEGGIVFVHCVLGQSRSVSCILMNMNYADGLALIRLTRPIARPNLTYQKELRQFSQKMFGNQ